MQTKLKKLPFLKNSESLPSLHNTPLRHSKYSKSDLQSSQARGILQKSIQHLVEQMNDYQISTGQSVAKPHFLDSIDNSYLKQMLSALLMKANNNIGPIEKQKVLKNLEKFVKKNKPQSIQLLRLDIQKLKEYIIKKNCLGYKLKVQKVLNNIRGERQEFSKHNSYQQKYHQYFQSLKLNYCQKIYRKPINERINEIQLKYGRLSLVSPKYIQQDKILFQAKNALKIK